MNSMMSPISLTSIIDGVLTVVGVLVAMAAMLVILNIGLCLPWLLDQLDDQTAEEAGIRLAPGSATRSSADPARTQRVPARRPAANGPASPAIAYP